MSASESTTVSFERAYKEALEKNLLAPGVCFLASNADESFYLEGSYGVRTLKDGAPQKPFDKDTCVRLASCTKLLTAIAVLQCVERGLLDLDADITTILPELKDKPVVALNEGGQLVERSRARMITLRLLLTHSAGTSYHFFSPAAIKWYELNNRVPLTGPGTVAGQAEVPLSFEPGTSWEYGYGLDWAGKAVATVTQQDLDSYMQENIFAPLGITAITFWPQRHPEIMGSLADMYARDKETSLAVPATLELFVGKATEELGGQNGVGRVGDYFKVLQALLRGDEKILQPESLEALFAPHLGAESKAALKTVSGLGILKAGGVDGHVDGTKYELDFALGGMVCREDVPGFKGEGSMWWGGYPLLEWWVDRKKGVCGFVACQMESTGDQIVGGLHDRFTRAVYERLDAWKEGKGR